MTQDNNVMRLKVITVPSPKKPILALSKIGQFYFNRAAHEEFDLIKGQRLVCLKNEDSSGTSIYLRYSMDTAEPGYKLSGHQSGLTFGTSRLALELGFTAEDLGSAKFELERVSVAGGNFIRAKRIS